MSFGSSNYTKILKSRIIGKVGEEGLEDGNFEEARFNFPKSICFLPKQPIGFVCDYESHCIRMIDFEKESVITIAGNKEAEWGYQDGNSRNSLFCGPHGIVFHQNYNRLFVSDQFNNVIRQIDISSICQQQSINYNKNEIDFLVSTVCGNARQSGFMNGIGKRARLLEPTGIAFSLTNSNILYFCDSGNHCIRSANILTKQVSTITGNPNKLQTNGLVDGMGNEAKFGYPTGICVDKNENLFVCELGNHSIRKINMINNNDSNQPNSTDSTSSQFIVTTLFGNPYNEGIKDGNKSVATLQHPNSILFDSKSNILIFTQCDAIRQIKLGKSFLEWKLTKIFLIYRILFKQCHSKISKRVLLQLISLQILQISSSDENSNNDDNQNYQWQQKNNDINKMLIEKQNKITEYIKSNSNLANTSKSNLLDTLFSLHIQN